MFILSLLSLFLGVTTVTGYAESNTVSVEAGIQFVEDPGSHSDSDSSSEKPSNEAGSKTPNEQGAATNSSTENTGALPKTGERRSIILLVIGILLVQTTMACIFIRTYERE
ncbi:LPXTG cell wall anchor domain-containing protein [Enterococcus faecium]|nr:LPXTG cell wall anchor domain-containing protein [Enterococcus faecium]EME8125009.1 LPXTG cell wall anchor domain-containing protein [Enterococcus faecium]